MRGVLVVFFALGLCSGDAGAERVGPSKDVTSYVSVRARPSKASNLKDKLPKDQSARLIKTKDGWHLVELGNGKVGWVSADWTNVLPDAPAITSQRVASVNDIPSDPPAAGSYRIHMIDVGTGLAILLQGADFNMLFDAGTNDRNEKPDRVLSYLFGAIGPSGGNDCVPAGDTWVSSEPKLRIDHVFLSHPHNDHGSAIDRVLECYDVGTFWDSGAVNDTIFYREVVEAVAAHGNTYMTAKTPPANRLIKVNNKKIKIPTTVTWKQFDDTSVGVLGDRATFAILHADGDQKSDPNQNSIVVRVDLGDTSILLTGDAESGDRKKPAEGKLGDIEKHLVEKHADKIDVDILQVGHHGSMTSSRKAFLDVVTPSWALVSSGPLKYKTKVLPDKEVLKTLEDVGATVLSTTDHDKGGCDVADHVGIDEKGAGGCDNHVVDVAP